MMNQVSYVIMIRNNLYVTMFALIKQRSIDVHGPIYSAVENEPDLDWHKI